MKSREEPPQPPATDSLASLALLVKVLEDSIPLPFLKRRVGLDAVLGLVPGVGDAIGAAVSSFIIWESVRRGVPAHVALKMLVNVAIDSVVGAVPFLGDLFDAGWKSNTKNLELLRESLEENRGAHERTPKQVKTLLLILIGGSLVCFVVAVLFLLRFLVKLVVG